MASSTTSTYLPATWSWLELIQGFIQAPSSHLIFEVILILGIIRLLFSKSYKPHQKTSLTKQEKEELVAEWQPDPLVPDTPPNSRGLRALSDNVVYGTPGKIINLNGQECLNLSTMNFLNFVGSKEVEEAALKTLHKYGVGSCGPRGFYGTLDVHLDLEDQFAKFMNCEEAALYSYNFATIASAIPAYAKRTDVIFCDEGVCFAIQKGIQASRSKVYFFKHNDVEDLERLMKIQEQEDKKDPKKAKVVRRFLCVEGLYMNHADICPLPQLVELKYKYKVRLFIDESLSFGVLGATGRGVTEHFGIEVDDIDLITLSLEHSLGSVGGIGMGKHYVIDHQRLSGLGYGFSASLPPLLATAAMKSLSIMEEKPEILVKLRDRCQKIHAAIKKLPGMAVEGIPISPVQHLRLATPSENQDNDIAVLQSLVDYARTKGVALTVARYLEKDEFFLPEPSIRLTVNCDLTDEEINQVTDALMDACEKYL